MAEARLLGGGQQRRAANRPCPACGWEIRAEAVKCRYCGSPVTPAGPEGRPACWPCRIAAAVCVLALLAGVVAFVLTAGGQ